MKIYSLIKWTKGEINEIIRTNFSNYLKYTVVINMTTTFGQQKVFQFALYEIGKPFHIHVRLGKAIQLIKVSPIITHERA